MWSITKARGTGAAAMFVRVAEQVAADIRRGVLRGGDRLPSTRVLAARLDVNRNTVVAAFDELIAQGWAVSRGPRGTFVSSEVPERPARREPSGPRGIAARPGFAVATPAIEPSPFGPPKIRYQLSIGVPDTRLLPRALLARAYRRALRSPAARGALDYGEPHGAGRLREAIAAMLRANRAMPVEAANILITRGSQMALDLIARLLVRPGDLAAVEELGYRPAWRALAGAGARLAPIGLDGGGAIVDDRLRRARVVYVTPHHQYPTTVVMSPARRSALLELARRERLAIIEDDYDHEFHFDGRPIAPLASADRGGNVIYVGTLSKILAPGLRLGFVAAPVPLIDALARLRTVVDRQGDHVLEHAVAELIEDGEVARHAHKMRRIYLGRRDALVDALGELPGLSFQLPAGGMTLWARIDDGVPLEAWRAAAAERDVWFAIARDLALDGKPRPFIRLAFARYDETEIRDAVRRLRLALAAVR